MEMNSNDESKSVIGKLWKYKEKGYVFHGSTNSDIETLEPRQATDTDKENKFNNDLAVFATSFPEASIIFACCKPVRDVPLIARGGSWSIGWDGNYKGVVVKIPAKWQSYISSSKGYVYVLKGDNFGDNGGWQVKSKESVVPVDTLLVSFSDFEKMGGKIIWKES